MVTDYRKRLMQFLEDGGISDARFEADCILKSVLGCTQAELLMGATLSQESQWQDCMAIAQERVRRVPLQYLLKEWEFYGLPFFVGEGVLIPRADTEVLCETAISLIGDQAAVVLDLCAGSGCITVAVGRFCKQASLVAVECSAKAIPYLKANLKRNRVVAEVIEADATLPETQAVCPRADFILCNPPYLTAEDMCRLQPEVTFEPPMALFGGNDGLDFYRILSSLYKSKLRAGGRIFFEIGRGQHKQVEKILVQNGYVQPCAYEDYNHIVRVVSAAVPSK